MLDGKFRGLATDFNRCRGISVRWRDLGQVYVGVNYSTGRSICLVWACVHALGCSSGGGMSFKTAVHFRRGWRCITAAASEFPSGPVRFGLRWGERVQDRASNGDSEEVRAEQRREQLSRLRRIHGWGASGTFRVASCVSLLPLPLPGEPVAGEMGGRRRRRRRTLPSLRPGLTAALSP